MLIGLHDADADADAEHIKSKTFPNYALMKISAFHKAQGDTVRKDFEDAARRVQDLSKFKGIRLFAQAERNGAKDITPNAAQIEFAQRYVYSGLYRKETWREYCGKRGVDYVNY